jgi:hypothetical protein
MFRSGFSLSHNIVQLPNHATVSTEDLFHSNLYTVKKFAQFSYKIPHFAELLRKILPVQIRAQTRYHIWASFIRGGLFLLTQDTNAVHFLIEIYLFRKRRYFKKGFN